MELLEDNGLLAVAVEEAGLSRVGDPVAWWTVFEVVGWLAGEG